MSDSLFNINDQLKISIILVLVSGYLIYDNKPTYFFKENGEFKQFGLNSDETPFPFFMVLTVIGFLSYYGQILYGGKYV